MKRLTAVAAVFTILSQPASAACVVAGLVPTELDLVAERAALKSSFPELETGSSRFLLAEIFAAEPF